MLQESGGKNKNNNNNKRSAVVRACNNKFGNDDADRIYERQNW